MTRPRQPEESKRKKVLQIRMTKEERSIVDAKASKEGQETSTWARKVLLAYFPVNAKDWDEVGTKDKSHEPLTPPQRFLDALKDLPPRMHDLIRSVSLMSELERQERRLYQILSDLLDWLE